VAGADSEADDSIGAAVRSGLHKLLASQAVGDVRGKGLLWGVEFVSDKETKAPFAPEIQFSARVAAAAAKLGVMTYPMQGCVDGEQGDHLLLAPPAVIKPDEVSWAVEQLSTAITQVHEEVLKK
jgi:adenosylmethionine-8-amino-7-oxononanoate aminotransferase